MDDGAVGLDGFEGEGAGGVGQGGDAQGPAANGAGEGGADLVAAEIERDLGAGFCGTGDEGVAVIVID